MVSSCLRPAAPLCGLYVPAGHRVHTEARAPVVAVLALFATGTLVGRDAMEPMRQERPHKTPYLFSERLASRHMPLGRGTA